MKTFFVIIRNTFAEYFEYRLNFIMWRFRSLLRLAVIYFLWLAIYSQKNSVFGYNESNLLTYILLTSLTTSIVFSTRSQEIGMDINQGNLNNLLLKPVSVFNYWLGRDLGDKLINILFSIFEFSLLIIILKPPFYIQNNISVLLMTIIALIISVFIYFLISLILSFIGFWSNEIWGPRFFFFIIIEFFAGGLFPLDILPKPLFNFLELTPFTYLLFFPIKIYLGQITTFGLVKGLIIAFLWTGILFALVQKIWKKGLLIYGAYGR